MANRGKLVSVYMNAEVLEKFNRLMDHMGYGVSQTVANLVDVRDKEIVDGVTRRETMKKMQKGLAELQEGQQQVVRLLDEIVGLLMEDKN